MLIIFLGFVFKSVHQSQIITKIQQKESVFKNVLMGDMLNQMVENVVLRYIVKSNELQILQLIGVCRDALLIPCILFNQAPMFAGQYAKKNYSQTIQQTNV